MKFIIYIVIFLSFSFSYAEEKQAWPHNCNSAVEQLLSSLSAKDKTKLRKQSWNELIFFHHGLGTRIRNNFGLWQNNNSLISSCAAKGAHPDGVSTIIIEKSCLKLNLQHHCKHKIASQCIWFIEHGNKIKKQELKNKQQFKTMLKKLKYLGFYKGSLEEAIPKGALKAYLDYSNFLRHGQ